MQNGLLDLKRYKIYDSITERDTGEREREREVNGGRD
jgi:hypothetical protein